MRDEIGSAATTAEIVRDFGEMAQVAICGRRESRRDGEAAYAELVEYVRVSVQLVFEELAAVRAAASHPPSTTEGPA